MRVSQNFEFNLDNKFIDNVSQPANTVNNFCVSMNVEQMHYMYSTKEECSTKEPRKQLICEKERIDLKAAAFF